MQTLGSWDSPNGPALQANFANIDEELLYLRSVVAHWREAPEIRNLALEILKTAAIESRDKKSQALAIGSWVQTNIYYVHELPERFQTPRETLRLRAGDCDDSSVLIGALLESVGIPSMLIAMNLDGSWAHIFPAAPLPTGLLPLDSTMRDFNVWQAKNPCEWAIERGKVVKLKMV